MDIDNPYYNYIISFTVPDIDNVTVVDYDALEQRIYWSDVRTQTIKRAFINGTGVETVVSAGGCGGASPHTAAPSRFQSGTEPPAPQRLRLQEIDPSSEHRASPVLTTDESPLPRSLSDLPNAHGLSVDWVSRNLFWTSYDANKKQINVARLDGSFKNAVIQGLDKPHCLVVHPLRG